MGMKLTRRGFLRGTAGAAVVPVVGVPALTPPPEPAGALYGDAAAGGRAYAPLVAVADTWKPNVRIECAPADGRCATCPRVERPILADNPQAVVDFMECLSCQRADSLSGVPSTAEPIVTDSEGTP